MKQDRADDLEGVYKKQKWVIKKLERLVVSTRNSHNHANSRNSHNHANDNDDDDNEVLLQQQQLQQQQQDAQQRIQALEKQVRGNY